MLVPSLLESFLGNPVSESVLKPVLISFAENCDQKSTGRVFLMEHDAYLNSHNSACSIDKKAVLSQT